MGASDFKSLYQDIQGENTNISNPFSNYSPNHSYTDMMGNLDSAMNAQTGIMQRNAANSIQRGTRDTTARMASQGITGGSVLNNQLSKVSDNVNTANSDALAQLGLSRMQQTTGLMNTDNANQMAIANANVGVQSGNRAAMLQKNGLEDTALNGMQSAEQYEDSKPGFWSGALGLLNAAGNVAKGAGSMGLKFATGGIG